MALQARLESAPNGALGFDASDKVDAAAAKTLVDAGFRFATRYISRMGTETADDLTTDEAQTILDSGLALMVVQHVAPSGWQPNMALGEEYGVRAAENAGIVGLPTGMQLWLDLEGVAPGASSTDVVQYCNAWFDAVTTAGFSTGLYVGSSAILTGDQLFHELSTQAYWRSGSRVPDVSVRSYCMYQWISPFEALNRDFMVGGVGLDVDIVQTDLKGGTPLWLKA